MRHAEWYNYPIFIYLSILLISRHHMVEQEDGEEFVVEIVNEIVESTMKVLHDQYIISQTLPYTIQETKNLLLQIIEVINLCHL